MSKILAIGDIHCPVNHPGYLSFCQDLYDEWGCDSVVFLGDIADFQAISFHANNPLCPGPDDEYILTKQHIGQWHKAFPKARVCIGNHDCLDPDTLVFTDEGWLPIAGVTKEHSVATLNGSEVEFQKPTRLHRTRLDGEGYRIEAHNLDLLLTPNHRIAYKHGDEIRYKTAEHCAGVTTKRKVPIAGHLSREYDVTDNELTLTGWSVTDVCYSQGVCFYQRGSNAHKIASALDKAGVKYSTSERTRNITAICGKELKNKPEKEVSFRVAKESFGLFEKLTGCRREFPKWVFGTSDRQFKIFLEAVVEGDGTFVRGSKTAWVVYKDLEFLENLAAACSLHGIRSFIKEYRQGHYRLNICLSQDSVELMGSSIKKTAVNSDMYCLTVPNSNFLVMRNGKPCFTGNCRVIRLAESVNIPSRFLRDYSDVWATPGWDWREDHIVDDVYYTHGTGYGGIHPAWNIAGKMLMSVVVGHLHSRSGIKWRANPRRRIFSIDVGCGIDVDAYQFAYGKHMKDRPVLSAAVILDGVPYHEIMPCGNGELYHKSNFKEA